jgi:hypothetical protein
MCLFYPANWQGTWKVRQEVVVAGATSKDLVVLKYTMHFLPCIQDNVNQANLEAAICKKTITADAV